MKSRRLITSPKIGPNETTCLKQSHKLAANCLALEMVFASLASCQSGRADVLCKKGSGDGGNNRTALQGSRSGDCRLSQAALPLQGLDTKIDAIEAASAQSHLFPTI
jgi:hypothetical protein